MSSLFGNTNNNTNTGGSGLFGTNNNVNPQSSSFPNSATSQPASSVFKFPSLGTTQQQKPNIFTPSSQQASLQPNSSDLFGSLTKNAQLTSTPTSNLFNSSTLPANTQNIPYNSSAVNNGLNTPNQTQNTAYFDSILDKSRKRTNVEPSSDDLPQLQLGLGDLRQRIKRLGTGIELNRTAEAHYLLAASGINPGEAIRDLNNFASATGYNERSQLPAQPDTDIETYLMNLQTQTTLSMIQDGLARSVRDFNNFLEDNVTMEWNMQKKRIFEHFGIRQKEDTVSDQSIGGKGGSQGTFVKSRRNKPTGLAGSQIRGGDSVFGRKSMFESVIGTAGPVGVGHRPVFQDVEKQMEANNIVPLAPHDRLQRDKQIRYAEKVTDLNLARIYKYPYPLCTEFISVVEASSENHGPDLIKAYKALIEIAGENPSVKSLGDPRVVGERHFATTYFEESSTKQKILFKKKIIRGGSRCLEKLAFKFMEETIAKNPREASLGGIPDVINKVKAYVRLQASRKNLAGDNTDLQMLGDDYVWALIYSLLRTGHIKEADQYVKSNVAAFRAIDRNFASYIHAYASDPDRRLPSDLQIRINGEYNQRLRIAPGNSIDPYRMVCYKIVGRCDLKQRHLENIPQSVEDFAWVQVVLAREINRVDAVASEIYGLSEAQNMIKEIGHRFFSKGGAEIGSSFGAFVFLQIAVGLFEEAVSYLYSYNYVDGVHLAIALGFYGLLRAADPSTSEANLLSLTIRNQAQISFGPMLALYTRDFRTANVSAAVDYIVLMCLNKDIPGGNGRNQLSLCHEALRELILESREFANLLGDMRSDGQRVKGIIEERTELIDLDEAGDFFRTITLQAASQADDNGRVTDAILLYHLAEEYDSVISTLNRALAQAVSTPLGQSYERLDPVKQRTNLPEDSSQPISTFSLSANDDPMEMARTILVIYGANRMFIEMVKPVNIEACGKLQMIQKAKNCVENEQWSLALDIMNDLAIIPLSANGDANAIRALANAFTSLAQPLAATVPHLLMWSILCSNKQREILAASLYGGNEGTRLQMVEQMRQINMDLMTFVGQLRYRLPASLHEALARSQGM